MLKKILFLFAFVIFGLSANAQPAWEINAGFGLAVHKNHDFQLRSVPKNGLGYCSSLGFIRYKENATISVRSNFHLGITRNPQAISGIRHLIPSVEFNYLRHVKFVPGLQLGAYTNVGSLLNFKTGIWSSDNTLSYLIQWNLGPSVAYVKNLDVGDQQIQWRNSFQYSVLHYYVRPSYTFPYPDQYLEDGVFRFDREGLGRSIIQGGKIATLNELINWRVRSELYYNFPNTPMAVSLEYGLQWMRTYEIKPVKHLVTYLQLTLSYGK